MRNHIGLFQNGTVLIAAAIGIFGPGLVSLRAEVSGQAGTGITIEMGEPKRLSPQEIRDRGISFRAELDKAFDALPDSGKAGHANEFTAIAAPYISAGMTLEDAEAILRAAGFAEPPRPRAREEQDRNKETDWYVVVAEIPQFSGRVFGNIETYVMLLPPEQGLAEFAGRRHRLMFYPRP
jgi:hypothetical protein